MDKKGKKPTLEDQIKTLERHFGGFVATVRNLKVSVDDLKQKFEGIEKKEIREMVETQKVMEEVVVANSDTIDKLKKDVILIKVKGPNVECTNER